LCIADINNRCTFVKEITIKKIETMTTTINKTWFKNQLRKGNLLVKCTGKYTDDYAFDNATNFSSDKEFKKADANMFDDWYLGVLKVWGDKQSEINACFAHCEYYTFKVAQ
jgi:hypothetical protein